MGLHHFHDNEAGGSVHGEERGGLTDWGRQLLRWMAEHGWARHPTPHNPRHATSCSTHTSPPHAPVDPAPAAVPHPLAAMLCAGV